MVTQISLKNRNGDKKNNVVLVGGCFDILHIGHIQFLKKAKALGDSLVILLESDEKVHSLKGEGRPFHTQQQRKEMLEALSVVDEVIALPVMKGDKEYFDLIKKINPSIIACTEHDPLLTLKQKQADMIGAHIVVIPHIETPSTTTLAKLLKLE